MEISRSLDWMARAVCNHPQLWKALGNIESKTLIDLEETAVKTPVYICGLPRSGSTILLEILASHPEIATHRYNDFPFLFTPYWWSSMLPKRQQPKKERAHGDGIMVNPQSPEAMEEILWMAFFDFLHSQSSSVVLDGVVANPAFERFYHDHIRKLLLIRKAGRYVTKNNYNITRISYISRLFPDARFIIPMREPASHIASLMRQHERFCAAGKKDSRVPKHMSLSGHFEFGLNRLPIHCGDAKYFADIKEAWAKGEEVRGWALYWDMIYRFIHNQLIVTPGLKERVLFVPFETLCSQPRDMILKMLGHARLPEDEALLAHWPGAIHAPGYYQPTLSADDLRQIHDITRETAQLYYPQM